MKFCIAWIVCFLTLAVAIMFSDTQTQRGIFEASIVGWLLFGFVGEKQFIAFEDKIRSKLKKRMKL